MAKYGEPNTVTGKSFLVKAVPTISTAMALGIADEAELSDIDSAINQDHLSGKQEGAMVAVRLTAGKVSIAVAGGDLPEDPWYILTLGADVVPV